VITMSDVPTLQEEDGFHEIQLNGKQLVFLGMTTTLVSVVIFLCGVLVGRGVKPIEPVAEAATAQTASAESTPAPAPAPETPEPAPAPAAAAAAAAPPPVAEEAPAPPPAPEPAVVKPEPKALAPTAAKNSEVAPRPAPPTPAPAPVAEAVTPAPATAAPATAASAPEASDKPAAARTGGAIAVQVAALTSRSDAEAIARRLSGKGYAAYILSPDAGGKQVFKVRVGNYASADEAARVSRRLRQEEKLQPWVIR
jgi:cell division septation protein DedD